MKGLIEAAITNNLKRVRLLVEQGADKDEGDSQHGWTPLWCASLRGHLEVAQYLVEQGAALDKTNTIGTSPLTIAAANGRLEVARYLLEQGADRDKASNSGHTPLHYAAINGQLEIAMLLMNYGADLNARNNHGQLPIDWAETEEIRQAIRDEPRRRIDHGHKRATEQDRHPNAPTSASAQQGVQAEEKEQEGKESNKRPRLNDEGALAEEEETNVAEEDEDSEPSDEEEDD